MIIKHHMIQKWTFGRAENIKEFKEKYIQIPMPWKSLRYNIQHDDMRICRPVLGIYWHNPALGGVWALNIRIGWINRDAGPKGIQNIVRHTSA